MSVLASCLFTKFFLPRTINLAFLSKYQKGATIPTGETEFQFKLANLNFHSTAYEWLVIAGAKAQYKGTGTINGSGSYGFMLTAIDGQVNGGGGVDKFRMKIWGWVRVTAQTRRPRSAGEHPDSEIARHRLNSAYNSPLRIDQRAVSLVRRANCLISSGIRHTKVE